MNKHLFYLSQNTGNDKDYTGAPRAVPYGSEAETFIFEEKNDKIINVSKEYKWTRTLKEGRENIPNIILEERHVDKSSTLSNILYFGHAAIDAGDQVEEFLAGEGLKIGGSKEAEDELGNDLAKQLAEKFLKGKHASTKKKFLTGDPLAKDEGGVKYLEPYNNLYYSTRTGFKYIFPYLENDWKTTQSQWDSSGGVVNFLASTLIGTVGIFKEGFSLESAQSYKYPSNGSSIKFSIQLDNTLDLNFDNENESSWQKNWQLIFLLSYQNLGNRETRFYVRPSHLYRVDIEGLAFFPYCYISSLQVKMLGNRKLKPVSYILHPHESNPEEKIANTLIPEVYELDIELTSMLPETQNLFFHSINKNVVTSVEEEEE